MPLYEDIYLGTWTSNNSTVSNSLTYIPVWDGTRMQTVVRQTNSPTSDPLLKVQEGVAREEDPRKWLERRVNEICWVPA